MKKLILGFLAVFLAMPFVAHGDDFDFDDFAIVDADDFEIADGDAEINDDAEPVGVGNFDIAGVYLGMSFDDAYELFYHTKGLYAPRRDNSIIYAMQKDWKYNLDYECRQQGIVVPRELEQCINSLGRKRGLLYASEMHLERGETGETLDIYFTSNATDNEVWRIEYNNDVNELEGPAEKFENQRQKKIMAFWQSVLDKYGAPNSGTDRWLTSNNSYDPMMRAYYGSLVLVDNGRNAADIAQSVKQARENFQVKSYAF